MKQPKALGVCFWIFLGLTSLCLVLQAAYLLCLNPTLDLLYRSQAAQTGTHVGIHLYGLGLGILWLLLSALWGRGKDLQSRTLPDEVQRDRTFSAIRWRCWGSLVLVVTLNFAGTALYARRFGLAMQQLILEIKAVHPNTKPSSSPSSPPPVPTSGTDNP